MERRKFFKFLANSVARSTAELIYHATKPVVPYLRPPGSADEDTFLSLCQKCLACVKACPSGVLEPVRTSNPVVIDTPFMNFDNNPCQRCYECIKACQHGALTFENLQKYELKPILLKDKCVAYHDIFCQTCYWSCPKLDSAIVLNEELKPVFTGKDCQGCGSCIHACPTEPKAIIMEKHAKSENS